MGIIYAHYFYLPQYFQHAYTIINIVIVLKLKSIIQKQKNGILVENATSAIGQQVNAAGRVTNVRKTTATTQIMLKDADEEKYILPVVLKKIILNFLCR